MAIDKQWAEEMCRRGMKASRIWAEKRRLEAMNPTPGLKPFPDEILQLHLPKPSGESYMVQKKGGLWDVYKNGEYFDTFDTKGQAWNALYED